MPVPTPTVAQLAKMAILGPTQREMVQREVSGLERTLRGGSSMHGADGAEGMSLFEAGSKEVNPHLPDANVLKDQLDRNIKTLRDGSAPMDKDGHSLSPQQKNQLWKLAKELREKIKVGMPSHEQLERPTQENLDVFRIHQERTIHEQIALRNIHRMLDSQDETVVLETLRPTQTVHVDWEAFWGNYDKIFFSESSELDRQIATLDDSTYVEFLKLKAMGISSPKLILRELNVTQAAYEACMLRLQEELGAKALLAESDEGEGELVGAGVTGVPKAPEQPKGSMNDFTKQQKR